MAHFGLVAIPTHLTLYLRCLACLALSVLGPLLSDIAIFADDLTPRLLEQTYIYDLQGRLKEILDSSGIVSPSKLPATCRPIDTATDSKMTSDSPTNSISGRERNPRRSGTAGEDQVIRELETRGAKVLGREITLKTPEGTTRVDMVIKNAEGGLEIVEVKNGVSARLTPKQQAAFVSILQSGAEPRGEHATRAQLPVGGRIGPTPVRIIRVVACP